MEKSPVALINIKFVLPSRENSAVRESACTIIRNLVICKLIIARRWKMMNTLCDTLTFFFLFAIENARDVRVCAAAAAARWWDAAVLRAVPQERINLKWFRKRKCVECRLAAQSIFRGGWIYIYALWMHICKYYEK